MANHHGHMGSGFPLRKDFFRSLPLTKQKNDKLYELAKQNARTCLNQSFNDQWRYVPPEKDGTQIRKDTSNLASSYRLVRAATVLRCQEHEVNQVIANTNTESWREFMRKCFGKYYVDTIILHTVANPNSHHEGSTSSLMSDNNHLHHGSRSEVDSEASCSESQVHNDKSEFGDGSATLEGFDTTAGTSALQRRPTMWPKTPSCRALDNENARGHPANLSALQARQRRCSETGSVDSMKLSNQESESSEDLIEDAEELLTVKWGAFETGLSGKRDLCLVDYQSLAYVPNTDKQEAVHVWCFTSAEGERVGCMELKDTHGATRTTLTKLGVFWRKLSEEETEVIICGSFPSKHAHMTSSILLTCLNRLQGIIEDLRMSSQLYIQRSTWVNDKERKECHLCMRNFHALRRKHHCRKCGEVVCSDCSTVENVDLPVIGCSKLRLCKVCSIRARSTPLKRMEKSNVFDHMVRARSLSNINPSFARSSYAESKHTSCSSEELHLTETLSHHGHLGGGLETSTRSSSSYSSNNNTNNNSTDDLFEDQHSGEINSNTGDLHRHNVAAIHPISRSTHPDEFDEFLDSRCLKTQLTAMEQQQQQQAHTNDSGHGNSNMFDLLCELACQTLNCPIASVSIIDTDGEFIRSSAGVNGNFALDDELTVFIDKIMGSTPAIVLDANVDKQVQQFFSKRAAPPTIRFFAGCPIYSRTGKKLGYVCVADFTKRDTLGASCAFTMERLATLAVTTMERNMNAKQHIDRDFVQTATATVAPAQPRHGMNGRNNGAHAMVGRVYEVVDEAVPVMYATPAMPNANNRYGDYHAGYYEAQERMRKLLVKSYHTQQQLASGGCPSPSTTHY